jgi:hypothetical protein
MKQKTDEKDGREKFRPGESALSGKRNRGYEAQSGALVGKETKTKEKDEVWMKQLADAQRTRAQESACGREGERKRR